MRGAVLVSFNLLLSGWVQAEEFQKEIEEISAQVLKLEQRYLAPIRFERAHQMTAKMSEGQLFFLTKDYDLAAVILLDVVENQNSKKNPGYADTLFYLAESLYQIRNFNASLLYFDEIFKTQGAERRQKAVARLLEISLNTRNILEAERYLELAGRLIKSHPNSGLLYAVGKYYYRLGNLKQSKTMFRRIKENQKDFPKALYFLGVIHLKEQKVSKAYQLFERTSKIEDADQAVIDEAKLALARIHYERGEFNRASGAYASINRESNLFDQALYESVWISIKQGKFEQALRKLDIQLISEPNILKGPDALLLKGKLLMMLNKYDQASDSFQEILFEFARIQMDMKQVLRKSKGNLRGYFNRLIGQNFANFDLNSFLPERAAEFAGPDMEADRALVLVSDLAIQRQDVEQASKIIKRIEIALSSGSRVKIFPKLHEGWLKAVELRNRIVQLQGEILRKGNPEGAARHKKLAALFSKLPRSVISLRARAAEVDRRMATVSQNAHEQSVALNGLEAQLVAIEKYINDLSAIRGSVPKDDAIRRQLRIEYENLNSLKTSLFQIKENIEAERIKIGINDTAFLKDKQIREKFRHEIANELKSLDGEYARSTKKLYILEKNIDRFLEEADKLVEGGIVEIKRQIRREKGKITRYDEELSSYQGQTETLGGSIAARSFKHVKNKIDGIVLEADVGLIDVSWKQKEDQTSQISRTLERKKQELDLLESNMKEVTTDD